MNKDKLLELIAGALDIPTNKISMDTHSSEIEQWDSLGQINVLMAFQEHFGDDYEEDPALSSATSVKEIYDILNK